MSKPVMVVGIDSSPRAQKVIEAARLMAERMNASVVLAGAVEGLELRGLIPAELATWNGDSLTSALDKSTRAAVAKAAEQFHPGTVIDQKVEAAAPWRMLVNEAKRRNASLIVLGAHGYRPVERMLGTTAAKVANRAECSVLVVRQAPEQKAPVGFERIAVAHDGSERATGVLNAAVALARPSSGRIILIRGVVPPNEVTPAIWGKGPDEIMALLEQAAKVALDKIRGSLPDGVPGEACARIGIPSEIVRDIARDKDATLLVIGSHGFDALDRVLGTTAGRIVNVADRSVLIIRGNALA
ncbi:MAG: universal stress protein [Deltaproteobacteria bacterium]|nr:universal stress protein [Deltaproteobacteria bacterium]